MQFDLYDGILRLGLAAPDGGAMVRVRDGERVIYEGRLGDTLSVELDAAEWGVPEPVRDLLDQRFPPVSAYSREAFKPLATPFIGLATLRAEPGETPRWTTPCVVEAMKLPLPVMAGVLHYAQSVFEGGKVYFRDRGEGRVEARAFRGDRNAQRMWDSARRMAIPLAGSVLDGEPLDEAAWGALFARLVREVVRKNVEAGLFDGDFGPIDPKDPSLNWTAALPALYVRPILFASGPVLGVKPAPHYTFAVYVTPAGKYRSDLVLKVETERSRAWPGGTGAAKASCNYAPTLSLMQELAANKSRVGPDTPWTDVHDDLLFLDAQGRIEEMGGANFFVLERDGAEIVLRTPASTDEEDGADTILPGVTRATVIELAELLGARLEIGPLPLARLVERSAEEQRDLAVFTTGTAAGIAPVVALRLRGEAHRFAVWDAVSDPTRNRFLEPDPAPAGSPVALGRTLRAVLFRLQFGDEEGLRQAAGARADAILERCERDGWIESYAL